MDAYIGTNLFVVCVQRPLSDARAINTMKQIAVYCSSSDHLDKSYYEIAARLGRIIAKRHFTLVYGGGDVGLMGAIARAVHSEAGHVVGVIPDRLRAIEGVAYEIADELIVTKSMSKRKSIIWKRSDAFVALAGGIGTLEEFLEVITLKKLGYHDKPVALVNSNGIFDPLLNQFAVLDGNAFSSKPTHTLFDVVSSPEELFELSSFGGLL